MTDAQTFNPRAARHLAVLKMFMDYVYEVEDMPQADLAPSEQALLSAIDTMAGLRLIVSVKRAQDEMNQLARAVLAGD